MQTWLKRIWFRIFIYIRGLRFYETNAQITSESFRRAIFLLNNDEDPIEFLFYKEEGEDLIYRRSEFHTQKFVGYIIQAKFPDAVPKDVQKFNGLKIFFHTTHFIAYDEALITEMLLHIYLDFIRARMKNKKG